ncbi:hypothetical protein HDU76_010942 [Blyttiomyces sp. JEL0837]|nr:hypothetical protein HDU76_010942 [Blyttiomyces sp. JEL0837]
MRSPTLKTLLINQCGGLIGALRQSVDSLKVRFLRDITPPELALLQHVLSENHLANMSRCFGSAHSDPIGDDFKLFLKRIFVNEKFFPQTLANPKDEDSYWSRKKAGILVELPNATVIFSSLLAKRYYFKWIFPDRSLLMPASLHELIRNVIASMSSSELKHCTAPGEFPNEAVFQRAVTGETDFYLGGELCWGIELLFNGDGTGEHLSRFSSTGVRPAECERPRGG